MSVETLTECDKVTRIEIIDTNGRRFFTYSYKTVVQLQDSGLTLKVFINDLPYEGTNGSQKKSG